MAKIIALAGKGGVGKTTICSAFVRILGEKYPQARILAIDADPAVGLATALGVEDRVKVTLDDLRRDIIEKAAAGAGKEAVELLGEVRFRIFDALVETEHFAFLAIGRPEGAGCYCAVNAYLKEVIDMVGKDFDYVVIDGEAGIEQINRRVMEKVTHLFLITDASKKGFQVARSIKSVADDLVMYEKCGLIINRVGSEGTVLFDPKSGSEGTVLFDPKSEAEGEKLSEQTIETEEKKFSDQAIELGEMNHTGQAVSKADSLLPRGVFGVDFSELIAVIPSDSAHAENDILGRSIFELPVDAPVYQGALTALKWMGI